jgi:F0F1-type ATP synthase alpha subunit
LSAANLRKVDIPIPSEGSRLMVLQHVDDLISMSDGQIWLDERLQAQGQQPPINSQRSITRIGIGADTNSRADAPAFRQIDGRFRLDLSQAANMVGADETNATKRQIQRRDALLLAMHQTSGGRGRRLSESCVVLLAATEGKLDAAVAAGAKPGTAQGHQVIQGLLDHVLQTAPTAMAAIDSSLDLSNESKEQVMAAVETYFANAAAAAATS